MKGIRTVSSGVQEVPALDDLQGAAEPVWLWDAARRRIVWSNGPGLAFFGAETLFDLIDRRFSADEPGVARVSELAQSLDDGQRASELLQFPSSVEGEALRTACYAHGLPDGRRGLLVVGQPQEELEPEPASETEVLNALPLALALVSPSGQILTSNSAADDLFDIGENQTLQQMLNDEAIAEDVIRKSLSAGTLSQVKQLNLKYGLRDVRLNANAIGSENSRQLLITMEDVTDRRALERRLREHAEHLSDFVASAADFTWELDSSLVLVNVSEGFEQVTGSPAHAVTGVPWTELCERHGIDSDGDIKRLLDERSAWKAEVDWAVPGETGESAGLILSAVPVHHPDGTFGGYRGIGAGLGRYSAGAGPDANLPPAPATAEGEGDNATTDGLSGTFAPEKTDSPDEITAEDDVLNVTASDSMGLFAAGQQDGKEVERSFRSEKPFTGDDGITPLDDVEEDASEPEPDEALDQAETDDGDSPGSEPESAKHSGEVLAALTASPTEPDEEESLTPSERSTFNEIGETIAREALPDDQDDDDEDEKEQPSEESLVEDAPASDSEAGEERANEVNILGFAEDAPPLLSVMAGTEDRDEQDGEDEDNVEADLATNSADDADADDGGEEDEENLEPVDIAIEAVKNVFDGLPNASVIHRGGEVLHLNPLAAYLLGFETQESALENEGLLTLFGVYADDLMEAGAEPVAFTSAPYGSGPARLTASTSALSWPDGEAVQITLQAAGGPGNDEDQEDGTPPLPDNVVRLVRDEMEASQQADGPTNADLLAMLNTATDGIMTLDDQGRVLALNNSAQAMFGYDNDEVRGKQLSEFLTRESHDSLERYMAAVSDPGIASVLNDGREVTGIEKNGGEIPLFLTLGKLDDVVEGEPAKLCAVLRDLTSWKKTEAELVEAREAAELASAQKSEFLANISHEIRTPLNAILGFSEVMKARRFGEIDNAKYSAYVNDIHSSGEHLLSLINDLLDLSKVEAGKLELNFASVDLGEVINQSVGLLGDTAKDARVIVRSSVSDNLPNVVADQRSMRQIMLNLLSNAIKFTDAGGQVLISARLENDGHISLKVKDTGRGMTEEQIQRALEPFRQVEEVTGEQDQGTGLGLPLTKALAEANRATFSITSEPEVGTIVEIAFPTNRVLAE